MTGVLMTSKGRESFVGATFKVILATRGLLVEVCRILILV